MIQPRNPPPPNAPLIDLIKSEAVFRKLPWELVYAICQVESSLNPLATRYEPNFRWLVGNIDTMTPLERHGQMTSWGLMQVMGSVARELGFAGQFDDNCALFLPSINLFYGCLHLRRFKAKYNEWPDVIAAYNAGSPRRVMGSVGAYVNQPYVDKVLAAWNNLEVAVPLKDTEI